MVEPVSNSQSPDEETPDKITLAHQQPAIRETSREMPREIKSAEILQGEREVLISHGEDMYRLSLTRNGKLILHK